MRIFFVPLCLCMGISAYAQLNPNLPKPGSIDSIGVNIHFTDPKPGEMKQIAAAGLKWVRMDFLWGDIEKVRGTYDFSAYDRLMRRLDEFKIRPIFILDYGNDNYEKGSPKSPEARGGFARFAAAAVTHFKGRGVLWEMWNEPNGGFWTPRANVDEYIALALDTGRAIKAAQPNEPYIGPATSGMDFSFIEKCFQAGLLKYWDAVSFHPYRNTPPETAIPDFSHVKALIAEYAPAGKEIPIISGEWGYSELYPGLSLDLQSKYIAREFLTNISNDLIVSIWYDWHDDGQDPKEEEHHFGTVYPNYKPKPTYIAAKTLAGALAGMHFNKRLTLANRNDYCLLFSNNDGKLCLAAWTTDREPHTVTLPASAGAFDVISRAGQTSTSTATYKGISVELSGAPMYLKPTDDDRLLSIASKWVALPSSIRCDTSRDVTKALRAAFDERLILANRPATISVSDEATNEQLSLDADHIGFQDLKWQRRNAEGARYLATLKMPGYPAVSQEIQIYPMHPVTLTAAPAQHGVLQVSIDNPTGAAITGRVRITTPQVSSAAVDVKFAAGDRHELALLGAAIRPDGKYRVQLSFEEQPGDGQDMDTTLVAPIMEYQPYEAFTEFNFRQSPPKAEYTIEPDGDPKVGSRISMEVDGASAQIQGEPQYWLRIDYDFDPGWKFLRIAPHGSKHEPLSGKPIALGMSVYGDGSGNILNCRYVDSTGQTFQSSAGAIDWKDWRFIQFSLDANHASHWGGANDGVIHYPIALDTVALVDSHDRGGGKGSIKIADVTIIQRVESGK